MWPATQKHALWATATLQPQSMKLQWILTCADKGAWPPFFWVVINLSIKRPDGVASEAPFPPHLHGRLPALDVKAWDSQLEVKGWSRSEEEEGHTLPTLWSAHKVPVGLAWKGAVYKIHKTSTPLEKARLRFMLRSLQVAHTEMI